MVTDQAQVFFSPATDRVGDVIPTTVGAEAWLFYLLGDHADQQTGSPRTLTTTRDFVIFVDPNAFLPSGGPNAADFDRYTSSVVTDDDSRVHSSKLGTTLIAEQRTG